MTGGLRASHDLPRNPHSVLGTIRYAEPCQGRAGNVQAWPCLHRSLDPFQSLHMPDLVLGIRTMPHGDSNLPWLDGDLQALPAKT